MEPIAQARGHQFRDSLSFASVDTFFHLLRGVGRKCSILTLTVLVTLCLSQSALSQSDPKTEYKFKAVYLYNLLQFVEWPKESFQEESSPIVIGILGQDPFGQVLDQTVQNEKVQNHEIVVRRFTDPDEVKECHLLFMCKSEKDRFVQVLRKMENRNVLTVGEIEGFAEHGGAVNFYVEKSKLRFEVNTAALKKNNLKVSSKLLRLTRIVNSSSEE
ncbi:MAG: YfiR family protein [Ignavibacteriae bacterium]|nr:YfiR family protein [Ignavibacteria bacterium]MBI3363348.1 YfiR family protein [Ignavibacteriota bacterium]